MSQITEEEALDAIQYVADHAADEGRLRARRMILEEYRKVIKSKYMNASGGKSVQQRECDAYTHQGYKKFLAELRKAIEADETARLTRMACMAKFEAWRTIAANKRSEKNIV